MLKVLLPLLLIISLANSEVFKHKDNYYSVHYYCYGTMMEIAIYKVESIADNTTTENFGIGDQKECHYIPDQSRRTPTTLITTNPSKLALSLIRNNYTLWE